MKQNAIRGMARAGMVAGVVLGSSIVWAADEPPLGAPGEAVTRVRFERGSYKPGYETLRVVRRSTRCRAIRWRSILRRPIWSMH